MSLPQSHSHSYNEPITPREQEQRAPSVFTVSWAVNDYSTLQPSYGPRRGVVTPAAPPVTRAAPTHTTTAAAAPQSLSEVPSISASALLLQHRRTRDDSVRNINDRSFGSMLAAEAARSHQAQPVTGARVDVSPSQQQQQGGADTMANDDAAAADQPTIEEMLRTVIVHHDRPLENLPVLTPPELKIIGRCVTFTSETNVGGEAKTLHYEGLVGTINKDTVMLINVYRFTEEDFAQYKETQQKPADVNKYTRGISTATAPSSQQQQHGSTYSNNAAAAGGVASMGTGDATLSSGGGLALEREENEALSMVALTRHTETLPHARGRLKNCPATTGPIPYMTFMRNHIQNVKFGNDPQSSFYSLFRDPSRRFFDMQCLRMFVRRYIVHTSQGNNPRNVPMRAFVVCRCNCPDLDEDLLESVLFEELVHLVKVDRDMKRAQRRRARMRRSSLLNYRAPRGIFRDTGVLYLTGLPRQTLCVAALEFVFMIGLVVYYGVVTALAEPFVLYRQLFTAVPYLCACAAATLVSSMLSVLHSVRMSIPLSRNYDIVLCRLVMVTIAMGCSLLLLIVTAQSATLNQTMMFIMRQIDQDDLCAFYALHNCSGLVMPCGATTTSPDLLCRCDQPLNHARTCRFVIMANTQRVYVPLICFALCLTTLAFTDHFLHYRLFHAVRLIMHVNNS